MASIKVKYKQTRTLTQTINWPDDEMDNFDLANLVCNLEPDESQEQDEETEVLVVEVNGEEVGL